MVATTGKLPEPQSTGTRTGFFLAVVPTTKAALNRGSSAPPSLVGWLVGWFVYLFVYLFSWLAGSNDSDNSHNKCPVM